MKKKILIGIFWLGVWQLVSVLVHNSILLVGPVETLQRLGELVCTQEFWLSLWHSFARIMLGFLAGSFLGILLAVAADEVAIVGEFLSPLVSAMRSVPVASFIILVLIWVGSRNLSFYISLLIVFPILYLNTLKGLQSADSKLLEMAEMFEIPFWPKLVKIKLPACRPFLYSAFQLAVGMAWKSGVAAEVIGQPLQSVGNNLYQSKIYLDTAGVLAWTLVIILVSFAAEKVFLRIIGSIKK